MTGTFADKKFVFAGNRFFVLEEMLKEKLNILKVYAMPGSYLQKELEKRSIPFELINDKKTFIASLMSLSFDYFVSNGLAVILPIAKLSEGNSKQFINIHPSYLPDLRGVDPVPGALLYGRDSGATCHYMNDTIDGGDIIARVKIPFTKDLDCGLLYQLSFLAEREAFQIAFSKKFKSECSQVKADSDVYYTMAEKDKVIDFSQSSEEIIRRIKAFNTRSQGAYFFVDDEKIIVRNVEVLNNPYLWEKAENYEENQILLICESKVLVKKTDCILALDKLDGNTSVLMKDKILA